MSPQEAKPKRGLDHLATTSKKQIRSPMNKGPESITNYSKNSRGPSINGILERSAAAFGKHRRPDSRATSTNAKPQGLLKKGKHSDLPEVRGRQPSTQTQVNRRNGPMNPSNIESNKDKQENPKILKIQTSQEESFHVFESPNFPGAKENKARKNPSLHDNPVLSPSASKEATE